MKISAGLLVYRFKEEQLQVFLVHPGGPFWKNKDDGSWSIPKSEPNKDEEMLDAAIREFREETGNNIDGNFTAFKPIKQKSGKIVRAWAVEGDIDPDTVRSNTILIEWPPKSGKKIEIPEVEKGTWFSVEEAKQKINIRQSPLIDELIVKLK